MKSLNSQLTEKERQQRVYERAMKSIQDQRDAQVRAGVQTLVMYAPGDNLPHSETGFGKAGKIAQMFVTGFAFLVPSLLLWVTVL